MEKIDATKIDEKLLSHGNNITQKERTAPDARLKNLCTEVRKRYAAWVAAIDLEKTGKGKFDESVSALNDYVEFTKTIEKGEKFFNWRSDFASSVVPEYLYRIFQYRLARAKIPALFSTRSSVVEVTLAGTVAGGWNIRRKNQDLCIGLRTEALPAGGKTVEFVVPQIVFEVKTNIDVNKINGLDFSAERLKRSFPAARYFLFTETIDFAMEDNFAAGAIDEIYVGRRQLRSLARRNKQPLQAGVFVQVANDVETIMRHASLDRGHVYDRLVHGRLINAKK